MTMNVKTLSLTFQWTPNVLTLGSSEWSSFTAGARSSVGFLLRLLFDCCTTFGHGNQRHPGPLSNLQRRERRLVQFLLCIIFLYSLIKAIFKKRIVQKYLLSRVDNLISAPNCYCCNFNGRAFLLAFPLEFVCESRAKSRVQCVGRV